MNVPSLISVAELAAVPGLPSGQYLRLCAKTGKYQVEIVRANGGDQYRFVFTGLPDDWKHKVILHFEKQFRAATFSLPGADNPTAPCTQNRAVACPPDSTKQDFNFELPPVDPAEVLGRFETASGKKRAAAEKKVDALRMVLELERGGGWTKDAAVKFVAAEKEISRQTIWNCYKAVRGYDDKLWLGLLVEDRRGGNNPKIEVSAEFLAVVWTFYKSKRQPSFSLCLWQAKRHATLMQPPVALPNCEDRTIERRFHERYPDATQVLYREGSTAWRKKCHTSQRRDRNDLHALQVINGDGHVLDYEVIWPDSTKGRVMATFWMDLSSNYLFEPYLARSENTDTIHRSFMLLCEKHGIPKGVYIDNGMGYAGKALSGGDKARHRFKKIKDEATGVFKKLGVKATWAMPRRGQSKPIEPAFETLEDHLKVILGRELDDAYLGHDHKSRPEGGQTPIPFEALRTAVMQAVLDYNTRTGRRSKAIPVNGGNYYGLFKKKYDEAKAAGLLDPLEPWLAEVASRRGIKRKVHSTQGGVFSLPKVGTFSHPDLNEYRGKMVEVRYDPTNMHSDPIVLNDDGQMICRAKVLQAIGFMNSADGREAMRLERTRQKLHRQLGETHRQQDVLEAAKVLHVSGEELRSMDQETEELQKKSKKKAAEIKAAVEKDTDDFEMAVMAGARIFTTKLQPVNDDLELSLSWEK
jgi:hypothetical protein